jgi:hypothetical protein
MGFLSKVKNYKYYTEAEISELITHCHNQFEYDYLMDRLYFYDDSSVRQKKRKMDEYEVLPARTMMDRAKTELLKVSIDEINK